MDMSWLALYRKHYRLEYQTITFYKDGSSSKQWERVRDEKIIDGKSIIRYRSPRITFKKL